jgi:hypothetical protein
MDKVAHYQDIVLQFIKKYNEDTGGNKLNGNVQRRIIADHEHNSFQLLSIGWRGEHYMEKFGFNAIIQNVKL